MCLYDIYSLSLTYCKHGKMVCIIKLFTFGGFF